MKSKQNQIYTVLRTIREFVPILWKVSPILLISSILLRILQASIPILQLYLTKEIIDAVTLLLINNDKELKSIFMLLVMQSGVLLFGLGLNAVERLVAFYMQVQADFYFDHLVAIKASRVPLTYFDQTMFYDQLQRASSGNGQRGMEMVTSVMQIGQSILTLTAYLAILINLHWMFAVGMFLLTIPVLLLNMKIGTMRYSLMRQQTQTTRRVDYLMQVLKGKDSAKELRIFALSGYLIGRWKNLYWKKVAEQVGLERKAVGITFGVDGFGQVVGTIATAFILWLTVHGGMTLGLYVAATQALISTQNMLQSTALNLSFIYQKALFTSELLQFLKMEEEVPPDNAQSFPSRLERGIQVSHLSYAYPSRQDRVLQDITFQVKAGQTVAIVGENGAGKSTLVKCLLGLYRSYEGEISYDGIEVRRISSESMYGHMSAIFQDFSRYQMTVSENIGIGRVDNMNNSGDLQAAAAASGAEEFIQRLVDGYETELGPMFEGGQELSYGQWQKIALARALFRDGELIVLDEPTASMDPLAEAEVFEQFSRLATNRTAILISHRLGSCKHADHILVLEMGRLIEQGSHDELMRLNGKYATMFITQAKWYQTEAV